MPKPARRETELLKKVAFCYSVSRVRVFKHETYVCFMHERLHVIFSPKLCEFS